MDTLDVRGLPDEYTIWLQKMVDSLTGTDPAQKGTQRQRNRVCDA